MVGKLGDYARLKNIDIISSNMMILTIVSVFIS